MHRFRQFAVALSLLFVVGAAVARKADLADPAPLSIPAGLGEAQVTKDIKRALVGRGWTVALEESGRIESTLRLREHVARIDITYDASTIRIAYVDSTNLDYKKKKDGTAVIHANYLSWIDNIVKDMDTNLKLTAAES